VPSLTAVRGKRLLVPCSHLDCILRRDAPKRKQSVHEPHAEARTQSLQHAHRPPLTAPDVNVRVAFEHTESGGRREEARGSAEARQLAQGKAQREAEAEELGAPKRLVVPIYIYTYIYATRETERVSCTVDG
jgi:hypothetical protein